jgi:hypothetical protein
MGPNPFLVRTERLTDTLRRFRSAIAKDFIVLRARAIIGSPFNDVTNALTHANFDTARRLAWEKFRRNIDIQTI